MLQQKLTELSFSDGQAMAEHIASNVTTLLETGKITYQEARTLMYGYVKSAPSLTVGRELEILLNVLETEFDTGWRYNMGKNAKGFATIRVSRVTQT